MSRIHQRMRLCNGMALLALLTGCGGGGADSNQLAANQQQSGNASAHAMPSGPFAQGEMQMHERMAAAVGANASETWLRKMIEHHRGAVSMSQLLIERGGDPRFVEMARMTVEKQQGEIGEMERMLAAGVSGGTGEANPFGPVEQGMHQQMMAANGPDLSQAWARKMIAHHQGAVDMSELLVRQGGAPQVVALAQRTATDQRREIAHLEAMLRGEAMPAAEQPAPATARPAARPAAAPAAEKARNSAAPAAAQPKAAAKATASERPAQRTETKARPAPTPEAAPAPKATCTPEHAAMGHCRP